MNSYLLKLLPPRPDFAQTMSPPERDAMQAHIQYWTALLEKGIAVAVGPVADPSGFYGLSIVQLDAAADPNSIADNDPVIKASLGLRYEIHLMPRLMVRK